MPPEVELLRDAAREMRMRANAATAGPWESLDDGDRLVAWRTTPEGFDDDFEYVVDEPIGNAANAEHIASWHPAVALAVADLLEAAVGEFWDGEPQWTDCPVAQRAVRIAQAYLGEVP